MARNLTINDKVAFRIFFSFFYGRFVVRKRQSPDVEICPVDFSPKGPFTRFQVSFNGSQRIGWLSGYKLVY